MSERLIVVGGDAGGMAAASQARRRRGPDELQILAFERGSTTSYSACGIPYWIAGDVTDREALVARTPQEFSDRQAIEVATYHEVVAIDTSAATVTVQDVLEGSASTHGYDQLVIATGAVPVRPSIPGIDADGVLGVQTLDDGQQVLEALKQRAPKTAVVIGAGYIGIEMAEAMVQRGLDVHLADRSDCPMRSVDPDMGGRIAEAMRGMGIKLHLGVAVTGVQAGDDGWVQAVVTDDGELPCDLVILGTGTRPNTDLAADAGVPTGVRGGLVTDRRQHTSVDGVWAAGDCTQVFHRITEQPAAIALGTIANKQGRVAGINLGGGYATFPGVLGTAVSKVCGLEIARTGLGEQEALAAGFAPVCQVVESTTRAGYYPGSKWLAVKVVAERGSGRLLGAQIVGEEGAAKRIDVFAMALWQGITAAELAFVDLSYAPPFSPVWDPVLIAARKAADAVEADHGRPSTATSR